MFDRALLRLIRADAQKGMSALMEQYTGLVYTIVKNKISTVCSLEDIEETVSDVFIAFYNQTDHIDLEKGSLSAYLMTIAKRKAVDKFRCACKSKEINMDEDSYIEIPDHIDLENEAEKNSMYSRLIDEINALGEPDSTIIYHKYYYGESAKEIAQLTGLTDDNVRKRLQRALRKLENRLKGDYYED